MTINTNMYAIALYEAGLHDDPLQYMAELDAFVELLASDQEIALFFNRTYDEFKHVKEVLLQGFSRSFVNFLEIIYNDRVIKNIVSIREKYESLLMENGYLSVVQIVSKQHVSDEVKDQMIAMIENKYPKPYRISIKTDPSLLGGYLLRVNGDVYDTTLRSRLQQIKKLGGVINE